MSQNVGHNFSLSHVKRQVAQMTNCDRCVTHHTPGRINRDGTVVGLGWLVTGLKPTSISCVKNMFKTYPTDGGQISAVKYCEILQISFD